MQIENAGLLGVHFMHFNKKAKTDTYRIRRKEILIWEAIGEGTDFFKKKDLAPNLSFMSFLFDLTGFIFW